jgi:hypothetical protein
VFNSCSHETILPENQRLEAGVPKKQPGQRRLSEPKEKRRQEGKIAVSYTSGWNPSFRSLYVRGNLVQWATLMATFLVPSART